MEQYVTVFFQTDRYWTQFQKGQKNHCEYSR